MKKRFDFSLIAVLIIVVAFIMAAAVILGCVKLPVFREIIELLINY